MPETGRRYLVGAVAAVGALLLAGCAVKPPITRANARCALRVEPAQVDQPPESLRELLAESSTVRTLAPVRPIANAALLLSGGSQHGAFGAGYLSEWSRLRKGLPRFAVVTGVSTGAILSTWAFINEPEVAERAYMITRESEVLEAHVRRNAEGKLSNGSYLSLARRSAQGNLEPLRKELIKLLDDRTLIEVADASAGRLLLIAVVEVDSGEALMVDLGELARRFRDTEGPGREVLRDCYAAAIVASSSVPLAAPPTFIDNRMYIDGGARFGVIVPTFLRAGLLAAPAPGSLEVFMLVNGTQEVQPRCGRDTPTDCIDGADPADTSNTPHRSWNLLDLGLRSVDILTNQIYRFSVARVAREHKTLHFAKIDRQAMLDHIYPNQGGQTCAQWRAVDTQLDRPIEFYPRYMNCVVDYGRAKARRMNWGGQAEIRADAIQDE